MSIELNDIATWPVQLKQMFEKHHDLLSQYAAREKELSLMQLSKRYKEKNNFQCQRDKIAYSLSEIIKDHELVAYHCTRLLDNEILEIRINGLRPLSLELVKAKLNKARESGDLSEKEIENLLFKNECHVEGRSGKIWFVAGVSVLTDESAVDDLFTFWGGEALYNLNENFLKRIGTPCIIKCAIQTQILNLNYSELATKFEIAYLEYIETRCITSYFDDYITEPLFPAKIIEIYKKNDPDFKNLTSYHE